MRHFDGVLIVYDQAVFPVGQFGDHVLDVRWVHPSPVEFGKLHASAGVTHSFTG